LRAGALGRLEAVQEMQRRLDAGVGLRAVEELTGSRGAGVSGPAAGCRARRGLEAEVLRELAADGRAGLAVDLRGPIVIQGVAGPSAARSCQ
jgi:hypothetical protein